MAVQSRSLSAPGVQKRTRCHLVRQIYDFKFSASFCSAAGLLTPAIRTVLFRLVSPLAMVTEERGIANKSAKNSITAWLALPSTGGAVSASLSASPTTPVIAFLRARGWTFTEMPIPLAVSCRGIMPALAARRIWPCQHAHRWFLLQWRLQSHATCPWKARPSGCRAACALRSGRADRAGDGNTAARLQDF